MKKIIFSLLLCLLVFSSVPVAAQEDYSDEGPDFYYGVVSDALMTKIPIRTLNNINLTAESGPLFYRVRSLEVQHLENLDPSVSELLGVAGDSCTTVSTYFVVENRSDAPVCSYLWKNRLVTDTATTTRTKDVSDLCMDLYQPNASETVYLVYVFDDLTPSEITTLTYVFPNPEDAEGNALGPISKIHIDLDDYIDQ